MVVRVRIMYAVLGLPFPTGSCARGADLLGCFGLVWWRVTNCYHDLACAGRPFLVGLDPVTNRYHSPDLGRTLSRETFTKPYHRGEDITHSTETMCYVVL
jgi:hypothetical protein